ncbi:unnamed protein product, partial [Rotaria sp. Silwood2]
MIFDPGRRISNPAQELRPFHCLPSISNDLQECLGELDRTHHKRWVLLLLLPHIASGDVIQFVNNYVLNRQDLHSFYIIFNNGAQFHQSFRARFPATFQWCRSFTGKLSNDIRS